MNQRMRNAAKACLMLLVALFAFAQGSWAQEKKTPKLSLSQTEYTFNDFEIREIVPPSLTIDVDGNKKLKYQFTIQYSLIDADGKVITQPQDPATGTVLNAYGIITTGTKPGKSKVRITVTPIEEYANLYDKESYSIDYTITITKYKPEVDYINLTNPKIEDYIGNSIYDFDHIGLQYNKNTNYYQSTQEPLLYLKENNSISSNSTYEYLYSIVGNNQFIHDFYVFYLPGVFNANKNEVNKYLDKSNWDISSEIVGSTDAFTLKDNIITAAKTGNGKVKFTFTPKTEEAKARYYPTEKTVDITVVDASNGKIPVHIEFYYDHQYDKLVSNSAPWDSYAQKGGTFDVPVWKIVKDENGNDSRQCQFDDKGTLITKSEHFDQFVYDNQNFNLLKAKVIDVNGNDVTDCFDFDQYYPPLYSIEDTTINKNALFIYWSFNAKAGSIWKPSDINVSFTNNVNYIPALTKANIKLTVSPKSELTNLFDEVSKEYSLAILPRIPQIKITPEPSTVILPSGFTMSPANRFNIEPYFVNLLSGDTTWIPYDRSFKLAPGSQAKVIGTGFQYSFDISKEANQWIKISNNTLETQDYTRGNIHYKAYISDRGSGNEAFKIEFNEADRQYNFKYRVYSWNNTYYPGERTITYNTKKPIIGKLIIDPTAYVTYVNENIQKPAVKVVNSETGEDITSHYDLEFYLSDGGTGTTWVNPIEGNATISTDNELQIGGTVGDVTVTVNAYGKLDANEYYKDCDGAYTVEVKEKPNPMCSWEIIKADDPADALMGKLHFTGAGGLSAGYQISNAVPGLNIMFGKSGEEDLQVKPEIAQTEGEGNTDGIKGDSKQYISGTTNVTTDENGLPTSGTFFVLQPYTNGFVSADANWESGNNYILTDATGKQIESINGDGSFSTKTFSTALRAGQTYYLYATGTAMKLHGLAYDPAFLADGSNEKVTAISIIGGNTSTVPHLLSEATSNVELSANPAESITQWTDGDMPVLPERIEKDIDATISAKVNSLYTDGNVNSGDIFKQPSYSLKVTAIPSYWVADGRYAGNGQEVTTTNIPTNIRMYYGGWEGGANSPYMKDGNQETNMADNWTMAIAATEEKGIDGFKFVTSVTNIPRDERGWGMGQNERFKKYNLDAFNVPCRGSFVRFEPEENGTVIVYLMQNGICQWNSALQGWATNKTLQWNNVYITDETGANVALTDNLWGENNGAKDGGLYTTSKIQASLFGFENNGNAPKSAETRDGSNWDWDTEFLKAGNGTEEDKQELFANWTQKNIGDLSKAMRFSDGGLGVISDGYTRYTFKVKAGKTYFVSQRDAQLAFAGFSFVPEGFSSTYSKDAPVPGHTDKTYELDQNNKNNEEFLNQIKSESTDASAYSNVNVRLNRTFDKGKWAPLCLPFSVNQTQFKQIFGDDALIITFDYIRPNQTAHYTQHVYHYIEAGRPYFVKPSKDVFDEGTSKAEGTTTFKHVSLEGVTPITMSQECPDMAPFNYNFVGFYDPMNIPQYSYYMTTSNQIRKVDAASGKPIKGFRAYLKYNDDGDSYVSAAEAKILDDETATGIKTISVDERSDEGNQLLPNNGNVYDVSGRLVNRKGNIGSLQRGVYIAGGKKVVVK